MSVDHEPSDWVLVPLEECPPPSDLFKCRWKHEFRQMVAGSTDGVERRRAFHRFLATRDEPNPCPYHQLDWVQISRAACDLVARGNADDLGELDRAADAAGLDHNERYALVMLFGEPVFFTGTELGNGQHRICAMTAAGAEFCPVESK